MIQFSCDKSIPRDRVIEEFSAAFGLDGDKVATVFDERYPNVAAVMEMPDPGEAGCICVTLPDASHPADYPSGVEQRRSFTRLAHALRTTVFFELPVFDKYRFPSISFAVSVDGRLALALHDDDTLPSVEFDPTKANSLWLDHAEDIADIVFARRANSGHIILRELGGLPTRPTRLWLSPEDYLQGTEHLIADLGGRYQVDNIYVTADDTWRSPTLQEIVDETSWDPTLFCSGW